MGGRGKRDGKGEVRRKQAARDEKRVGGRREEPARRVARIRVGLARCASRARTSARDVPRGSPYLIALEHLSAEVVEIGDGHRPPPGDVLDGELRAHHLARAPARDPLRAESRAPSSRDGKNTATPLRAPRVCRNARDDGSDATRGAVRPRCASDRRAYPASVSFWVSMRHTLFDS